MDNGELETKDETAEVGIQPGEANGMRSDIEDRPSEIDVDGVPIVAP